MEEPKRRISVVRLLTPHWKPLSLGLLTAILGSVMDLLQPWPLKIVIDNVIGSNPGQVPSGAVVEAAMLDMATVANNGYGDGGQFFAMLAPWQDTDTWNTLVNGIQTDGVEAATNATVSAGSPTLNPNVCGGYMSFEVTPDAIFARPCRPRSAKRRLRRRRYASLHSYSIAFSSCL